MNEKEKQIEILNAQKKLQEIDFLKESVELRNRNIQMLINGNRVAEPTDITDIDK